DGTFASQEQPHDLERLLQPGEARPQWRQIEAKATVLPLLPARAEPEHQAAAREVVNRGSGPGGDARVAERHGCDQRPELDTGRVARQPGQGGPELQRVEVRRGWVEKVV